MPGDLSPFISTVTVVAQWPNPGAMPRVLWPWERAHHGSCVEEALAMPHALSSATLITQSFQNSPPRTGIRSQVCKQQLWVSSRVKNSSGHHLEQPLCHSSGASLHNLGQTGTMLLPFKTLKTYLPNNSYSKLMHTLCAF